MHCESALYTILSAAKLIYEAQKAHSNRAIGVNLVKNESSVLQYRAWALQAINKHLRHVTPETFAELMYAIDIQLVQEVSSPSTG